jgi:hypothetical protein
MRYWTRLLLVACAGMILSCNRGFEGETLPDPGTSWLRVAHLPVLADTVNLWFDGIAIGHSVTADYWIPYRAVIAGEHRIVATAGSPEPQVVIDVPFTVTRSAYHTFVITCSSSGFEASMLPDSNLGDTGRVMLRLVNLHPVDSVFVSVSHEQVPVQHLIAGPGEFTEYASVPFRDPGGQYELSVGLQGTGYRASLTADTLMEGSVYSMYVVGTDPQANPQQAIRPVFVEDCMIIATTQEADLPLGQIP